MKPIHSTSDRGIQMLETEAVVQEDATSVVLPGRTYRTEHDLGDVVYLKASEEPIRGIITGIGVRPALYFYNVRWATGQEDGHFAIELTTEAPI